MEDKSSKYVYIVISGTKTVLGQIIQKKLGVCYNHCSISLDENLERIYSFGRKELWHIFSAGFVCESKSNGFFKKYWQSKVVVLRIPVMENQWLMVANIIKKFKTEEKHYKYSLLGLIYCYLGIAKNRKNKYFCSQFVSEVLNMAGISLFDKPESLICPHDFLELPQSKIIYKGQIGHYAIA